MKTNTQFSFTIEKEERKVLDLAAALLRGIVIPLSLHRQEMTDNQKDFLERAGDAVLALELMFDDYPEYFEE